MEEKLKTIKQFYGGIVRDEKSKVTGAASNLEEIDIFTNADYIQAEQIFTADALPASTEVFAYTSDTVGTVFGYGRETAGSKVRIVSVATGGADNPGAFATLFTSADATNLAYSVSPIQYFKTTEATSNWLYYCTLATTTVKLFRVETDGTDETEVGTLTGLDGTFDRISFKIIAGTLHITNGNHIATVDQDGVFTNDSFNLPNDWIAVDIAPVGSVSLILARNSDSSLNLTKGFWWDLVPVSESEVDGYDDSFDISMGGPQWLCNYKETVRIFCASNGIGRFFQLNGAYQGSVPQKIPGVTLFNVGADAATQPISPSKSVAVKDNIIYFGLLKTDKSGMYAIGQLDDDKPSALCLSKRFHTSDYSLHKPTAIFISGPNFYAAFVDNGTASTARCESNNSPSRSTQGIYESIVIDDDRPNTDKKLTDVYVATQPLPASTDVDCSIALDYGSYNEIFRGDGTSLNTTSAVQGNFKALRSNRNKVMKVKLKLVSSTSNSPKVTGITLRILSNTIPAAK